MSFIFILINSLFWKHMILKVIKRCSIHLWIHFLFYGRIFDLHSKGRFLSESGVLYKKGGYSRFPRKISFKKLKKVF